VSVPRVCVVVPTYRRPDLLGRCLRALLAQDFAPEQYEIVVADDGPDSDTRTLVESVRAGLPNPSPRLRYVAVMDSQGPAGARNRGWSSSDAPVIAFTDDDCVPDSGWLRAGLSALVDGTAGVAGRIHIPLPDCPTDYELNFSRLGEAEFATANCFFRREALQAVGGFDESFREAWREDSDLYFKMLERGLRVVRSVEAVVVHPIRPGRWSSSLIQQRKNVWNALLYRKHPALYRQHIQSPTRLYYALVATLFMTVTGLVRRRPFLAMGAGAGWATLTGHFLSKRLRGTSRDVRHLAELAVTTALIPPIAVFWRLVGGVKHRVLFL
jgi:glycosyltransferase involved in cell wall biosynthesis